MVEKCVAAVASVHCVAAISEVVAVSDSIADCCCVCVGTKL